MSRTRSKNLSVSTDKLRDDVEALRDDVAELAGDARSFARQKVSRLADTMRETTSEAVERGRDAVGDECDRALDYARHNPLATLSVGLLAGFVLGTLLRGSGH